MDDKRIVSKVNEYLHDATVALAVWLGAKLPYTSGNWWNECVINSLSYTQREIANENAYSKLEDFDLAALLRVAGKSWYIIRGAFYLPAADRECVFDMMKVRNNWAHCCAELPGKDIVIRDLRTISRFMEITNSSTERINEINRFISDVEAVDFSEITNEKKETVTEKTVQMQPALSDEINVKDIVMIVGDPNTRGMVYSKEKINGTNKYGVFVDGEIKTFFEGQIVRVENEESYKLVDINTFLSFLTAYEVNNPSGLNLYSLNTSRIDFVPYQFRPALKMIRADEPRILIADSVGVGKTIEAGLIIKELEARNELESILVICPKPLVTEHKWLEEMKRFDEDFVELDGSTLRQAINETSRDAEWPVRYNKSIIPYSILDAKTYSGDKNSLNYATGLEALDPSPHFGLVIIDEAHHIRNGSLEKEKAFAYKCCKYFCDHSDAVIMLTATPLQTSDNDLFTLLNLLRPDVVIDKETFDMMARPNAFISKASKLARSADEGWKTQVFDALKEISTTQWGESVIVKNPVYSEIMELLAKDTLTQEERVHIITETESLHSFNNMLNRTRRKDIQDFCIRRSFTVDVAFTQIQSELHNKLLEFERAALATLHDEQTVPFMMSTIRRQASSCIFGLAPHIKDILNRRFTQMYDDPDVDFVMQEITPNSKNAFMTLASEILEIAENLPEEDPKFDSVLAVVAEKQEFENNKIILFSTFRHTLGYLKVKFQSYGLRVAQIDGSTPDTERVEMRERFKLPKGDERALDMLLFTEVGSEGLDYQFCDMMINYDLPWNPMKIEQRIGRIDRRGQKSETVSIYNIITYGTVDADIYYRCLMRIGVFERSIGECEEILGEIGFRIEKIAVDSKLSDAERKTKLEQMADNEVRRLQEISRIEDVEKELFAFDLSKLALSGEIGKAESPWISPRSIQIMAEQYLNDVLGEGKYIVGETAVKTLRLNVASRSKLRDDFRALPRSKSTVNNSWENFLKDKKPAHTITFDPESVDKDDTAFTITSMHPLARQAARHFITDRKVYINIVYASESLDKGKFSFAVYAWNYIGFKNYFSLVIVSDNDTVSEELPDILRQVQSTRGEAIKGEPWKELEKKQMLLWQEEIKKHKEKTDATAKYRSESLGNNYRNRKRVLEQQINETKDGRIARMKRGELENASEQYESKLGEIEKIRSRCDIHVSLIANGFIEVI